MSRIALVKPDRARGIEQLLMRMAQSGQLRGRVSEEQLLGVLDQVSGTGTVGFLNLGQGRARRLAVMSARCGCPDPLVGADSVQLAFADRSW